MSLDSGAIAGIVIGSVIGGLILLFLFFFLLRKWLRGPTKGTDIRVNLDGKVVAITGCNTGIGKVTAEELAKRGARVIMLCRNLEKAREAAEDIRKSSGGGGQLEVEKLDLSSLQSVRECAQKLLDKEDKLDILVNNAGVMTCPDWKTEDGFEMQFGTNHLGHFLLTQLLTPLLKKSAASGFTPRIVIVSSLAHENGQIYWDDINMTKQGYNTVKAYCQSKLANVLHAKELARRLKDDGIKVYSLHPGAIMTDLSRHLNERFFFMKCLSWPMQFLVKTPFYGAQTSLYCCLEPSLEKESGKYYSDCAEKRPQRRALIEEDWKRLWKLSEEMTGISPVDDVENQSSLLPTSGK